MFDHRLRSWVLCISLSWKNKSVHIIVHSIISSHCNFIIIIITNRPVQYSYKYHSENFDGRMWFSAVQYSYKYQCKNLKVGCGSLPFSILINIIMRILMVGCGSLPFSILINIIMRILMVGCGSLPFSILINIIMRILMVGCGSLNKVNLAFLPVCGRSLL